MQALSGTVGDGPFRAAMAALGRLETLHILGESALRAAAALREYSVVRSETSLPALLDGRLASALGAEPCLFYAEVTGCGPCDVRLRGTLAADMVLRLRLSRELYQRLGVDGRRVPRAGRGEAHAAPGHEIDDEDVLVRAVDVDLGAPGAAGVRRRMARCAALPTAAVPPLALVLFVPSALAERLCHSVLPGASAAPVSIETRTVSVRPPPELSGPWESPEDAQDACEDASLWFGAAVMRPNAAGASPALFPDADVCPVPCGAGAAVAEMDHAAVGPLVPPGLVADVAIASTVGTWLGGAARPGGRSFVLRVGDDSAYSLVLTD